jgi:hypothetical protein
MLEEMAEFLIDEDIINIEDDDININYDGIKEWIYGCD